jgi:hypothetical protein
MKVTDYLGEYLNKGNNPAQSLEEKTDSAWQKVRKGMATGIALAMLGGASLGAISKPAEAQERARMSQTIVEKKHRKLDFTIYPMEMYYSDGRGLAFMVTDGKQYEVSSDAPELYIKPQTRNGLTTEILFKLQDKDAILNQYYMTDDKGYITDRATGQRVKVIKESFDIDDFNINPGEEVMCEVTYEDGNTIYQTMSFSVTKQIPEQDLEIAKKEAEKKQYEERAKAEINKQLGSFVIAGKGKEKKQKKHLEASKAGVAGTEQRETEKASLSSRFSLKGAWLIGSEAYSLAEGANSDPENNFNGLFFSGQYFHPNLNIWANFMSLTQDVDIIGVGGAPMKQKFSQTSLGLAARLGSFYVEGEMIDAQNYYKAFYNRPSAFPLQESDYKGLFFDGGILILFGDGDGFASSSFIQAGYGLGLGKQKSKFTNGMWYDLTASSESITEKNFIKVRLKTPFLDGVYSQSNGENSDKSLHQKRSGGDIIVKLPLNTVLDGEIFKRLKLMGYLGYTNVDNARIKNYENTRYGIGIAFED